MSYVELYSDDVLDVVSLGHFTNDFNESGGDYIKVQIISSTSDIVLGNFYSNRLLFKYSTVDEYYFGNYHYHPENTEMGFCTGKIHIDGNTISNLKPLALPGSKNEPLNPDTKYRKHFEVFRDDNNRIYIKPNEIIKFLKLGEAKYKLRIYFLRNIKSTLGSFFKTTTNNLIENGNFLAGLEATQTGDLDRSLGRNNFFIRDNPGIGQYVLEQDGIGNNYYDMRITGIKPNTSYVLTCWVTWNSSFNGKHNIFSFSNTSTVPSHNAGLSKQNKTDELGSWIDNVVTNLDTSMWYNRPSRIIEEKLIGGLTWYRLFTKIYTNENADLGSINIILGNSESHQSTNSSGRRYFTDLRLESIENFETALTTHFDSLKDGVY